MICDNKCSPGCGRYSHILGGSKMEMYQMCNKFELKVVSLSKVMFVSIVYSQYIDKQPTSYLCHVSLSNGTPKSFGPLKPLLGGCVG